MSDDDNVIPFKTSSDWTFPESIFQWMNHNVWYEMSVKLYKDEAGVVHIRNCELEWEDDEGA